MVSVKRVHVERAKSDKSSCKKCQKKIKYGELRAGVDCWMGGRTVKAWLHMSCMAQCFKFGRCKAASKCKLSGEAMVKGEARLELAREYTGLYCMRSTPGEPPQRISFKLNHSKAALGDFLKQRKVNPKSLKGYKDLTAEEKKLLWAR
eukprot:s5426_g3.t2